MVFNPIIPIWLMAIICVAYMLLWRKGFWAIVRQVLTVALIFIINLRPMLLTDTVEQKVVNMDVLFVIDNTISMLAEDMPHDARRIDCVKRDCEYIMEQFPGARFSVIEFGNSVVRLTPYTTDTENVLAAINGLEGSIESRASGTSYRGVASAIVDATDGPTENARIVFFISDGEVTGSGRSSMNFTKAAEYINAGAVLGYGTTSGGPMRVRTYEDDTTPSYLNGSRGTRAKSKIDEDNLKDIAYDLGLPYVHMTSKKDADSVIANINAMQSQFVVKSVQGDGMKETFFYFLIPLIVLLAIDCICIKRKL